MHHQAGYWDVIQLCRQSLEVNDTNAQVYVLLAKALMQNKQWRREAAEHLRRATELDPVRVEYLGLLGALYQAEGLSSRANSMLQKAKALDPDYELPEIC